VEHASIALFPLFALCDRNDVGGICYPIIPSWKKPAIFSTTDTREEWGLLITDTGSSKSS